MLMKGQAGPDGRLRTARIDLMANAMIVLPNNHSYIHAGRHFSVQHSAILADTNVLQIALTPALGTIYPHVLWRVMASARFAVQLLEGPTSISGGTAADPINNNRVVDTPDDLSIVDALVGHTGVTPMTPTAGSVIVGPLYYGASSGPTRFGGESRDDNELILKPGVSYLWTVTSADAANRVVLDVNWYEYTPYN